MGINAFTNCFKATLRFGDSVVELIENCQHKKNKCTDRLVDIFHIETEQSTLFFAFIFALKISYRFSGWNGCPCMRFGTLRLNRFSANSATTSSFNKLDK